jgi:AcrB/AcrD/AcrF family
VSFVNKNRAAGMSIEEVRLEAGYTRLRPVWSSAITTLAGLVPTAYGWGGVEPFVQPMAWAMAWGLVFDMPITLFLVPLATLFMEDAKHGFAKMFRQSSAKDHNLLIRTLKAKVFVARNPDQLGFSACKV